jgi:beta-lactamase class D
MPKTERDHRHREKLLYQYSLALDIGDFEVVATVLAEAEKDPILERMILELNTELERESTYIHANNNHKGQTTMTVITGGMERHVPRKRQSRLTGAVALVAGMMVVLFGAYLLLYKNGDNQGATTVLQPRDTRTPTLQYNGLTSTVFWDQRTATVSGSTAVPMNQETVTAFWDQAATRTQVARSATPTPTALTTTEGFNANEQTATAFWIYETMTQEALDPVELTGTAIIRSNNQLSTATAASSNVQTATTSGLNENQRTATAFWDQATATEQVIRGTHTPGPTTDMTAVRQTSAAVSNQLAATQRVSNEQTATAFWDMQTQQPGSDLTAIAPTVEPPLATVTPPPVELVFPLEGGLQYPDFDRLFRGINGTFVMYDPQNDVSVIYNPERAQQRFAPHSTFKILNAAISLETGVMPDADFIIEWDQEQYPLTEFPQSSPYNEWRQDQNLRTGMQYSVVWFYTEVARLIGPEQMAEWVEAVGYGNMDTSAWLDDVPFWLGGSLEITPIEQTQFLWQFYDGQLGFSERTTDIVKDLIVLEETDSYRLSGKTGTGTDGMGWLVGYLERGDEVYVFALNLNSLDGTDRLGLTRQVFMEMGLIQ